MDMKSRDAKKYILQNAAFIEVVKNLVYNRKEQAIEYQHYEQAKHYDSLLDDAANILMRLGQDYVNLGFSNNQFEIIDYRKNKYIQEYKAQLDEITNPEIAINQFPYTTPTIKSKRKIK